MKLDRLLAILTILLQADSVTAPRLAERFEVSRRTISRDIDALCQAGIPVVTRQGGKGGISIAEGFKLDKSVLTQDELSQLLSALRGLGSVTEKTRTERLLEKLSPAGSPVVALGESVVIDLAAHHKDSLTIKIELMKRAIRQQKLVEFDYYYGKGECHRRMEPSFVVFQWESWYVFGYCLEREDWRLFKLDRLWRPIIGEESFTPRPIPPEKRDLNACFPDHLRLVALFDPAVKHQLIETYGLGCCTEEPDGHLRLEIGYTNEAYILRWLLGFGAKVRVLEPAGIAAELCRIAQNILDAYS